MSNRNRGELIEAVETARAHIRRGNDYYDSGKFEKAVAEYNKAVELEAEIAPHFWGGNPYAVVYNNRGVSYENTEQYDKSISDFSKAIDLEPERAIYYINRGRSYDMIDIKVRAVHDFSRAIQLEPDNNAAYFGRAMVHSDLRELDRAVEDINKALELNPRGPGVETVHYLVRAETRFKQRKFFKAFADLWIALARLPLSLFQRESDQDAAFRSG